MNVKDGASLKNTVGLQWLEHLWNHYNMFETGVFRAKRNNRHIFSIFIFSFQNLDLSAHVVSLELFVGHKNQHHKSIKMKGVYVCQDQYVQMRHAQCGYNIFS